MKIAIIGTGISGLGAAYLLNPHHEITVYEKNHLSGGHSRTFDAPSKQGAVPVDTGFIVFNHRNYPHLTALFSHLDVPTVKSDMSFGVSIQDGWLEYGTRKLSDMFAQKSNLLKPQFWKMLKDIHYFNRHASHYLETETNLTLGQCLDEMKLGVWFRNYYLLAMGGAIWSMPLSQMLNFPARSFLQFFKNHGLLTVSDQPQWYTVQGGSREYVTRLSASFKSKIKHDCAARKVKRVGDAVEITDSNGESASYDRVIFACHSDQALTLLETPTPLETEILSAIRYQKNTAVLHKDAFFMPHHKSAWASWVYLSQSQQDTHNNVSLTYWMNNLQPLKTDEQIFVTLNPSKPIAQHLVVNSHEFEHPIFDRPAIDAQARINEIQGVDNIWYCGAWQRYGFHEDGLLSAVNVAQSMGVEIPWK